MGDIYRAATKVHIWLGENTKDWGTFKWVNGVLLEAMGKFIREGVKSAGRRCLNMTLGEGLLEQIPARPTASRRDLGSMLGVVLTLSFERRWFRRLWTFQEALLARKTVMCGPDLDWGYAPVFRIT
jgi:hypothetical protein